MAEENRHDHSGNFAGMHSHEGGVLHWHDEFGEHVAEDLSEEELAARQLDWKMHNFQLVTVGVDVGSSTSHLMFSRINMQRLGEDLNTRFVVVGRQILWKSPIILTPYLDDNTIDVDALREFVQGAYEKTGATANDIDTGAIILTGEALKRKNSRAIAELFALETGKFVCATAGHHLEAVLAANGTGTVSRSRRDGQTLLNVDIGGGTTKLAVVADGEIVATTAIAIGARQLVRDEERRLTRIDDPVRRVAEHLGIQLALGEPISAEHETKIVQTWVDLLAGLIEGRPPEGLAADLMLTEPLPAEPVPQALTFSGGVSEYIFFRESKDFGDMGKPIAKALRGALSSGAITLPAIIDPNLGIRATAIGVSQFTVQVGSNVYVTDEGLLPLRNLPVLALQPDWDDDIEPSAVAEAIRQSAVRVDFEEGERPVAIALHGHGELDAAQVRALAEGIRAGIPRTIQVGVPFVLLVDHTISRSLGATLKDELGVPGDLISLEGVTVREFDFVDLQPMFHPSDVLPVTIKSLLFAGGLDRRSVKQALLAAARSLA